MNARGKTVLALLAAFGLGFAGLSVGAADGPAAQEGTNKLSEVPKDAKDSANSRSMQNLDLANQLIRYGRQEKHGESLLLAAQILHKTPTQPLKVEFTVTGGSGKPSKAPVMATPKSLVTEAKRMGSGPQFDALAMATEKLLQEEIRGAVGGPRVDAFSIRAGETINWKPIVFTANQKAEVYFDIGVPGRMVLQVFDQNNNLVAADNVPGNYFRCVWYPKWQGSFTFRLTNVDTISFNCGMATN